MRTDDQIYDAMYQSAKKFAMTKVESFAHELTMRLMQELTADGIHKDDYPDEPRAELFELIDETLKHFKEQK